MGAPSTQPVQTSSAWILIPLMRRSSNELRTYLACEHYTYTWQPQIWSQLTDVVKYGEGLMSATRKRAGKPKPGAKTDGAESVRATISFPPQIYETLEEIAKRKKVSLAWVVREAAERYVGEQWPLFAGLKSHE